MLPTPAILDLATTPLPATFAGRLQRAAYAHDRGALWRAAHHKRWFYASAATATHALGAAIVHLGYAAKAFVYVVDRARKEFVIHESATFVPGPWFAFERFDDGAAEASLRTLRFSAAFSRTSAGDVTFSARGKNFGLRLFLDSGASIVAANRLRGGGNVTEKTLGMQARGEIVTGDERIAVCGFGGFDVTDGFLPRHTRWHWASLHSERVSLNLVQDWMGACECVARIGDECVLVGEGAFSFDAQAPERPWRITSDKVALEFTPLCVHRENENLGIVRSSFIQPCGVFSGTVCGEKIEDVLGAAEQQNVIW